MAYVSFGVKSKKDKKIQGFVTLCQELGVKTLFSKRGLYGAFSLMGVSDAHIVELVASNQAVFNSLQEELGQEFSISQLPPTAVTSLGDIERVFLRIRDSVEKNFLVECHRCKRPLSIPGEFCPFCGSEVGTKLKICPRCDDVYAPSYNFCPVCREELEETEADVSEYANAEDFLVGIPRDKVEL